MNPRWNSVRAFHHRQWCHCPMHPLLAVSRPEMASLQLCRTCVHHCCMQRKMAISRLCSRWWEQRPQWTCHCGYVSWDRQGCGGIKLIILAWFWIACYVDSSDFLFSLIFPWILEWADCCNGEAGWMDCADGCCWEWAEGRGSVPTGCQGWCKSGIMGMDCIAANILSNRCGARQIQSGA